MNLQNYYEYKQGLLHFNRETASQFAKQVAGDFNPIHNVDARRFVVPGDLLFAVLLDRQGLYQQMEVEYTGMVTDKSQLLSSISDDQIMLHDQSANEYLIARHSGEQCHDKEFITALTKAYVTFSGKTFPHILVPIMREHNAMINPDRPMVMYRRMSLTLNSCAAEHISLAYSGAQFDVNGRKGEVSLRFDIVSDGQKIGHGTKNMVLSGLREFDQTAIDTIVDRYEQWKTAA